MGFDLDNEELIATRRQLQTYINNNYVSKEKVKQKIKANVKNVNDENFEGTNECNFYTKESRNWFLIIVVIVKKITISFIIYGIYIFLNLLCGG